MKKITKIKILRSLFCLFAVFLFNLPTLAALNINYGNLFVLPLDKTSVIAENTVEAGEPGIEPESEIKSETESNEQNEEPSVPNEIINDDIEPSTTTPVLEEVETTPAPAIPTPDSNQPQTIKVTDHNKSIFESPSGCSESSKDLNNFSFITTSFQAPISSTSVTLTSNNNTGYLLLTGVYNNQTLATIFKYTNSFSKVSSFLISESVQDKIFSFPGDFNGDSYNDFAIINPSTSELTISTFNLKEDNYSAETESFSLPNEISNENNIASGDFNLDGKTDILIANNTDKILTLLQSTDASNSISYNVTSPLLKLSPEVEIGSITASDFNNDNLIDIAVSYLNENKFDVFISDKALSFKNAIPISTDSAISSLKPSDINSDKIIDLIAASKNNPELTVFIGDKTGNFKKQNTIKLPSVSETKAFVLDIDSDCKNDIVVFSKGKNLFSLITNTGSNTFNPSIEFPLTDPAHIDSGDVNNDGYQDGVLSTLSDDSGKFFYGFYQGTSMASPHVAGVAALVLSVPQKCDTDLNGTCSPNEVKTRMAQTAEDLGAPGFDNFYGNGLVNALQAVTQ